MYWFEYCLLFLLKSKNNVENEDTKIEAAFFLAAAYGFKGRLYSNREYWTKAASAGKSALNYIEISKEQSYLSPELLFGEVLYNFYSFCCSNNLTSSSFIIIPF